VRGRALGLQVGTCSGSGAWWSRGDSMETISRGQGCCGRRRQGGSLAFQSEGMGCADGSGAEGARPVGEMRGSDASGGEVADVGGLTLGRDGGGPGRGATRDVESEKGVGRGRPPHAGGGLLRGASVCFRPPTWSFRGVMRLTARGSWLPCNRGRAQRRAGRSNRCSACVHYTWKPPFRGGSAVIPGGR